jgi:tetratricopeptide (TPR) repeat protein
MRANGDLDGAIAIFQAASELERGLRYDEPEPLPFSVRQWLGDALWEAGRHDEAIEAFRDELVAHPHNGWSLFGLERSLRAIGDDAEADEVLAERLASWERTDVYLRSPIY